MITTNNKSVADYYANKSVFITGGTGFLGKVFVEKLLYSCPDIDKVYMLIREKRGFTIIQRLKEFFDDPLFDSLKNKRPQDLDKVVPIAGDVNYERLGLSRENEDILLNKVSVVIHSAATVKLNEALKVAWRTNVEGTRKILELSQRMKRVEVFIHISTAYTNTNREVTEEVLYPPPASIDDIYPFIKQGLTEKETLNLIDGRPNTYTFTKALTEHMVAKNQARMSTIIVRPSVVGPIKDGCHRGWLQNWFGATGLVTFTAKGLNRVVFGHESNRLDLIPVDYVANLVVAAGAKNSGSNELNIYNCCTSECNPLLLGRLVQAFVGDDEMPKSHAMPFPQWYMFTTYFWLALVLTVLFQVVPACLLDFCRLIVCKRPIFIKLQSRVLQTRRVVDYFTNHSWIMKADRTRELYSSLSPTDKSIFPCDPTAIDWNEYLRDYAYGVREYLEKRI